MEYNLWTLPSGKNHIPEDITNDIINKIKQMKSPAYPSDILERLKPFDTKFDDTGRIR